MLNSSIILSSFFSISSNQPLSGKETQEMEGERALEAQRNSRIIFEIGESEEVEETAVVDEGKIATIGEQNFHRRCIAATTTSSITQSSLRHAMDGARGRQQVADGGKRRQPKRGAVLIIKQKPTTRADASLSSRRLHHLFSAAAQI